MIVPADYVSAKCSVWLQGNLDLPGVCLGSRTARAGGLRRSGQMSAQRLWPSVESCRLSNGRLRRPCVCLWAASPGFSIASGCYTSMRGNAAASASFWGDAKNVAPPQPSSQSKGAGPAMILEGKPASERGRVGCKLHTRAGSGVCASDNATPLRR